MAAPDQPVQELLCNHCQKTFTPAMESCKVGEDTLYFFHCSHCRYRYNVNLTTKKGVKMLARLKRLYTLGRQNTSDYKRLLRRYTAEVRRPPVTEEPPPAEEPAPV